jgi:hypothetical protein
MDNKKLIASDGKTAYERLKKKKHNGVFAKFGKRIMFRVQGKVEGGVVTERWLEGIWLGKRFHTEEHIVSDLKSGKVMRTRSIKQMPVETTWEDINRVAGKPWAPSGGFEEQEEIPRAVSTETEVVPERIVFVPKAVKKTESVLQDFGYSDNCKRCEAMVKGKSSYVGIPHSESCRARLEGEMSKSEKYKDKVEGAKERRNRYFEVEMDRAEEFKKKHPEIHLKKTPEVKENIATEGGSASSSSGCFFLNSSALSISTSKYLFRLSFAPSTLSLYFSLLDISPSSLALHDSEWGIPT